MLFGGITVALVIGIGFNDVGIRQIFPEQGFNPFPRDNVRSVLLPGMQLHSGMSLDVRTYLFICFDKSFSTKVTREIDDGLVAGTLFVRHILITVFPGNRIGLCYGSRPHN